MKRLLNYFVNGKGIGLLAVFGAALIFWGISGLLFNHAIKSFLAQPQTVAFLNEMPTVEIKDGRVIAPIISEQKFTFTVQGEKELSFVMDTATTDKPDLSFEQGIYLTADGIYLKANGEEQVLKFDPSLTETITSETVLQTLNELSGFISALAGLLSALIILLGYVIVYLIVLALGVLVNSALTFAGWGRIAATAWILTAIGFTGVFMVAGQVDIIVVIAFAVIVSFIFALKCRQKKQLSDK